MRTTLECSHCGGDAAESLGNDGLFYDGEGDECRSCGFPGHVVIDDSLDDDRGGSFAYWSISEADTALCVDPRCKDCEEYRVARVALKESTE